MSERLRCTLVSDGSSDRVLLPIVDWLLAQHSRETHFEPTIWAELRELPHPPKTLIEKIVRSLELYPCRILFIHRDAENQTYAERKQEIAVAFSKAQTQISGIPPMTCVIPVRMQEAWFLFDEQAIRGAAGNPNGKVRLNLPSLKQVESLADPKSVLHALLKEASEKRGRKLDEFSPARHAHRLTDHITDYAPLRQLSAFQRFEQDLIDLLEHFSSH
ncbi:MAG: DUF4276 family protein [Anaerolinea sp.]|nr:DUF4276 family protein [Anaerolinea sp.]